MSMDKRFGWLQVVRLGLVQASLGAIVSAPLVAILFGYAVLTTALKKFYIRRYGWQ